jgi:hypothetical protein
MHESGQDGASAPDLGSATLPAHRGDMSAVPTRFGRVLAWVALLLACATILAHAGLIFGGHWDGDEFFNVGHYRQVGLQFLFFRIETWDPWRSLAEVSLYLYFLVAQAAHAQLIAPYLAVLWATLIGAAVASIWRRDSSVPLYRLNVALCVVAMFLLGHKINEMFYWPMAAAPYVQSLAALTAATFLILNGDIGHSSGRLIAGIALSLAVLSAETGLFFVIGLAAALCVLELPGIGPGGVLRLKRAGWYLVPFGLSVAELAFTFVLRIGKTTQGIGPNEVYFHHAWPSLLATLQTLPNELAWSDPASFAASLVLKLLILLGFYGLWSCVPAAAPRWRHLLALAAGLASAMVLVIFASFYQYSTWGFERHRTFLQCMLVLLLLVVGRGLATAWRMPIGVAGALGPLSLIAAMVIGLAPRLPGIVSDYALLPEIRDARFQTWNSGMKSGPDMRFVLPPHGHVLEGMVWQTGHFSVRPAEQNTPWYVPGLLNCFGKDSVDIVQSGDDAGKQH